MINHNQPRSEARTSHQHHLSKVNFKKMNRTAFTAMKNLVKHLKLPEAVLQTEYGFTQIHHDGLYLYPRCDRDGFLGGFYLSSDRPKRKAGRTYAAMLEGITLHDDEDGFLLLLSGNPPVNPLRVLMGFEQAAKRTRQVKPKTSAALGASPCAGLAKAA